MKENKLLIAVIAVMIAAVIWAIIATTGCVMLDTQKQELKEQITYYKDRYHSCLEGKFRLQDR
jgi:hypothetical protein